jgi:hypothetical protein
LALAFEFEFGFESTRHVLLLQVALICIKRLADTGSKYLMLGRPGACSGLTDGYLEKTAASQCKTASSSGVLEAHVSMMLISSGQAVAKRHEYLGSKSVPIQLALQMQTVQ